MSRIGRLPINIPDGVQVSVAERQVRVKGPKGLLEWNLPESITASVESGAVKLGRPDDTRKSKALHGLSRALIANMVTGVSEGFQRVLEIHGTGYRASVEGKVFQLELGYSRPIRFPIPQGIDIEVDRNMATSDRPIVARIHGIDKQALGETAAQLRALRPPDPYRGRGVRYQEEHVRRKVGKKNV
jgi:large subunit ribosomal protein L6